MQPDLFAAILSRRLQDREFLSKASGMAVFSVLRINRNLTAIPELPSTRSYSSQKIVMPTVFNFVREDTLL
jgi:hypothetical protein